MAKTLVAYFSATGTTENAAKIIAEQLGADIYEIEAEVPYTQDDLNWTNSKSRSSVEMKDKAFRPAMKAKALDAAKYDVLYLGFPIWWYVAPTIINTFLESIDTDGKTIILFATSGGSGFGRTVEWLKASAPKAIIKTGKVLNNTSASAIATWINELK